VGRLPVRRRRGVLRDPGDRALPAAALRLPARPGPLGTAGGRLRVAADRRLPPFRLDQGGAEPGGTEPAPSPDSPAPGRAGWTGGRTAAAIAGAALVLVSAGLLTGGAAVRWADRTQRDADGYFSGSTGVGTQTLAWPVQDGDWTLVVLNADGSRGVVAQVEAGATVPALGWVAAFVLGVGLLVLAGGVTLIWIAARGASRGPGTPQVPAPEPERPSKV
jgi:hypothetical protein